MNNSQRGKIIEFKEGGRREAKINRRRGEWEDGNTEHIDCIHTRLIHKYMYDRSKRNWRDINVLIV